MGRGHGTWDAGTQGRWDVEVGDARTWGRGNMGCKNVPINKQHLKFVLNLQFTIFGGQ